MIANAAAMLVLSAFAVECVLRLPFILLVRTVIVTSAKAVRVVGSRRISDHWKEKVLLAYSGGSLAASLKLAGLLAAVAAVLAAGSLAVDRITGDFLAFLASPPGIVGSLAAAAVYVKARALVAPRSARV